MRSKGQQTVTIAGAGISGLTLAVALKHALGDSLDVCLCDPRAAMARTTGRASAIAAGPRKMLEELGIWASIEPQAQPILSMIITDSKSQDRVRPVYLRFGDDEAAGQPLAHMVEDDDLIRSMMAAAHGLGVKFIINSILDAVPDDCAIRLNLPGGQNLQSQLLVAADGGNSRLRAKMRIATTGWDYHQGGIVATLAHENPHEGRAEEHFLPPGPFAVLPLCGNRISIVWTLTWPAAVAKTAMPDAEFVAHVQNVIGLRLGDLRLIGRPKAFPLSLKLARNLVASRFALIGDAAHVIHPIAGQGLNLGLRDAAVLAGLIVSQAQLGLEIGAQDMLTAYQRQRRFDSLTMAATTDGLNQLFANDFLPLRLARDFGLGLVDRLPFVKKLLVGEASGIKIERTRLPDRLP